MDFIFDPAPMSFYLAGSAGVISHYSFFINGDHHIHAPMLSLLLLFIIFLLWFYHSEVQDDGQYKAIENTFADIVAFSATLLTSMTIYRVFSHPLRGFPGPPLARITKFWHIWKVRKAKNHLLMEEMFNKYGDFVRIGKCGDLYGAGDQFSLLLARSK